MQRGQDTVHRAWLRALRSVTGWAATAGAALLLITVLTDVTLRFALNQPIPGSNEYVAYWYMPLIVFCGLALAERYNEHIDAPLVFDRLPATIRREFTFVSRVLFLAMLLALAWWGFEEAMTQAEVGERGGASGVAMWPARFLVPIGALACAVEILVKLIPAAGKRPRPPVPESTQASPPPETRTE